MTDKVCSVKICNGYLQRECDMRFCEFAHPVRTADSIVCPTEAGILMDMVEVVDSIKLFSDKGLVVWYTPNEGEDDYSPFWISDEAGCELEAFDDWEEIVEIFYSDEGKHKLSELLVLSGQKERDHGYKKYMGALQQDKCERESNEMIHLKYDLKEAQIKIESRDASLKFLKDMYDKMKNRVQRLSSALVEKRSDISDILGDISDDRDFNVNDIEGRYINARIPISSVPGSEHVDIMYDTLTTLIEYRLDSENDWNVLYDIDYSDDYKGEVYQCLKCMCITEEDDVAEYVDTQVICKRCKEEGR